MNNAMVELTKSLRYKLRMFGVRIQGATTNIFCDNEAVYKEHDDARINVEEKAPFNSLSSLSRGSGGRHNACCKRRHKDELEQSIHETITANAT